MTNGERTQTIRNITPSDLREKPTGFQIILNSTRVTKASAEPTPQKHAEKERPKHEGKLESVSERGDTRNYAQNVWDSDYSGHKEHDHIWPDECTPPFHTHAGEAIAQLKRRNLNC
jgi:hypothetical protein